MLSFFKRRSTLTVLGFLLLALFIILAGPYFAFAGYDPLASLAVRLILVALVIGTWIAVRAVKAHKAKRASDKLMAAVAGQSEAAGANTSQLRESFDNAIARLKHRSRRGRTLYDLPWYLIIGAPGCGKSTVLEKSGLRFPLEKTTGRGDISGVGGTRNCKWWFSDDAVLLDTAGRYTTQDSDAQADAAEWKTFLGLLRKYRRRRPVNGVIFAVSADDLLTLGPQARELRVTAARRRLQELNQLGVQLPVYVMVTKCDLVAGFKEYFDDLTKEGRAQVWGVTFPYEQTLDGSAVPGFPAEFDGLATRLNERVFARLEDERDVQRSAKVFSFPQQMAALRESLHEFVTEVFAFNEYERPILLRGVYFTSGTQVGTPIDRLLVGALRQLGAQAQASGIPAAGARAYFVERLFKDVILAESGLAGKNRRLELQKAAFQLAAYAAVLAIGVLCLAALFWSFSRNRSYIADVAAAVEQARQAPPPPGGAAPDQLLPRLDAVRAVMESATRYDADTPLGMRWGLYQGNALGKAARDAYLRELTGTLLPEVVGRFERRLGDAGTPPDQLYEYLKAYLMLAQPRRLMPLQVEVLADAEWNADYARQPDIANAISTHFRTLVQDPASVPPTPANDRLVKAAQASVRYASIQRLVYSRLQLNYSDDPRALSLDTASGSGAEQVLRRKSGTPLTTPVPAIYTAPVFREIVASGITDVARQFAEEEWVWGEAGQPSLSSGTLSRDVIAVYEDDYIAFWDGILKDVELVPAAGPSGVAEIMSRIGGPTSPLRGLLQTVDSHTYLAQPPEPAAQGGALDAAKKTATDALNKVLGRGRGAGRPVAQTQPAGTKITKHFEKIHQLVSGPPGSAPIDRVLAAVQRVGQQLATNDPGRVGGALNPAAANAPLQELKVEVATLPPEVSALVRQAYERSATVVRGGVREDLSNRYQQEVVSACREVVNGNYPFDAGSRMDAPIADVTRIFGAQGVFDLFFRTHVEPLVDTSQSSWRWKVDVTGVEVGGSPNMLRKLEAARRIRDNLFSANPAGPSARFNLTPAYLDQKTLKFVLDVDGQRLEYSHGPRVPRQVSWPGQTAGTASVTFEDGAAVRPTREFKGEWALFRLLDTSQIQADSATRYQVTFQMSGHEARIVLDALSVRNPFGSRDLQQFRCEM